jgi:hypothetical protein
MKMKQLTAACVLAASLGSGLVACGDDDSSSPDAGDAQAKSGKVIRIVEVDDKVKGGVHTIQVPRGNRVRLVVESDHRYLVHILGYNLKHMVGPGQPARFDFVADDVGNFQVESHRAAAAGRDPSLAWVEVKQGLREMSIKRTPQCAMFEQPTANDRPTGVTDPCHG